MRSARIAIRRSCRAHNAFDGPSALLSVLCPRVHPDAGRRGYAAEQGPRDGGGFGDYEGIVSSLRRTKLKQRPDSSIKIRHFGPPAAESLSARQRQMEADTATARPERLGRDRKPSEDDVPDPTNDASLDGERDAKKRAEVYDWSARMQSISSRAGELHRNKLEPTPEDIALFAYEPIALPIHYPTREPTEPESPCPWALAPNQELTQLEALDASIAAFTSYIQPNPTEIATRSALVADVHDVVLSSITASYHPVNCTLFGSSTTGLALPTSDLDFRISPVNLDDFKPRRKLMEAGDEFSYAMFTKVMVGIAGSLRRHPHYTLVVLRNSRYPIITMQHRATGTDIQLVAAPDTSKQQAVTAHYLSLFPHLQSLYALIRTALHLRGCLDVFSGGPGSYGLLIMLAAALSQPSLKPKPISPPIASLTPGEQLLHILDFYTAFPYATSGLTLTPTASLFPKDPLTTGAAFTTPTTPATLLLQPYLLSLQDPANESNDLGRKSNAMAHVVATFASIAADLRAGVTGSTNSPIDPVVGRAWEVYAAKRARAEQGGGVGVRKLMLKSSRAEKEARARKLEKVREGKMERGRARGVMESGPETPRTQVTGTADEAAAMEAWRAEQAKAGVQVAG